jgi:hypothetical protein
MVVGIERNARILVQAACDITDKSAYISTWLVRPSAYEIIGELITSSMTISYAFLFSYFIREKIPRAG